MKERVALSFSRPASWLRFIVLAAAVHGLLVSLTAPLVAGLFSDTLSPGNVPWPGGVIPYEWDTTVPEIAVPVGLRDTYLAGLKEWELAGDIQWVERTTETDYIRLRYDPLDPTGTYDPTPPTLTMITLLRGNVCHESGHALGLEHEHSRPDRDTYVTVIPANIQPIALPRFDIIASSTTIGPYDFESVMHYGRTDYSIDEDNLNSIEPNAGFELYYNRLGNLALSPGDRATVTYLYGAGPALSSVVTNTKDTGTGSLRAAIYYANENPGTTITFAIPDTDPGFSGGVYTIAVTGYLPPLIADGTVIDGTSQTEYVASPVIALSGEDLIPEAGDVNGLTIYAADCVVRGLSIYGFTHNGIGMFWPGASDNTVEGCYVGVKPDGVTASPNTRQGVAIWGGAQDNRIGTDGTTAMKRNVISGNTEYGVLVIDPDTSGNKIRGNYLGTNAAGSAALGNGKSGVAFWGGAHDNVVGGVNVAERNVLSGNVEYGVWMSEAGTTANAVLGNYIGTNHTGTGAIANAFGGVIVTEGAGGNVIGGNAPGAGNVISGNTNLGVSLRDAGGNDNEVRGNLIGLNAAGSAAIANTGAGVYVLFGAQNNLVCANVLSGNTSEGLRIEGAGTTGNRVEGNRVGTDATGMSAVPNGFAGLTIFGGASGNTMGGTAPGAGNIVSGNATYGFVVGDAGSTGNSVQGNIVGLNIAGAALANGFAGVAVWGGAQDNTIGGVAGGASNIIAGNGTYGIALFDPGTTFGNTFSRNSISGNGFRGIQLGGANHAQAAPVLTSATLDAGGTTVAGSLTSTASSTFTIEFFASDAPGTDEGKTLIGAIENLLTDDAGGGMGSAAFNMTFLPVALAGRVITATATDVATGDTSEFSLPVTVTSADMDGDGMPDDYEMDNSLDKLVDDAGLNADGDTLNNLEEFVAGTDPQDSTDVLEAESVEYLGDTTVITFATVAGRAYRIEKSEMLADGTWRVLVTLIIATGPETVITDATGAGARRAFYRAIAVS